MVMDDYRDMYREFLIRKYYLDKCEIDELKRIRCYKKYGEKEKNV
jgi:hypothetical protein